MTHRLVLMAVVLMLAIAGCGPGQEEVAQVPTVMELPTLPPAPPTSTPMSEPSDVPTVEPTAMPTDTETATLTLEPTATFTDTPLPTATDEPTDVPTQAADVKSERVLEDRLMAAYKVLEGVVEVRYAVVSTGADGIFYVDTEIVVAPGYVTSSMADELRLQAYAVLASARVELWALLYYDDEAASFTWDNGDDAWRMTELTAPSVLEVTVAAMVENE